MYSIWSACLHNFRTVLILTNPPRIPGIPHVLSHHPELPDIAQISREISATHMHEPCELRTTRVSSMETKNPDNAQPTSWSLMHDQPIETAQNYDVIGMDCRKCLTPLRTYCSNGNVPGGHLALQKLMSSICLDKRQKQQ